MRVVFDTVILVRGLINPRGWCGRLLFDEADSYELVISASIKAEYLEVLGRPELARKYGSAVGRDLSTVMNLIDRATVVEPARIPPVFRDPEDDKFLATAKAGVEFIVSEDADLLDLGDFEEITIVSAKTFLGILDSAGA